jgi:hypothetical protein
MGLYLDGCSAVATRGCFAFDPGAVHPYTTLNDAHSMVDADCKRQPQASSLDAEPCISHSKA